MKAVLISTNPKWISKICNKIGERDGKPLYEKRVEVRKTKPKLETPFKCYIYCTSSNVHECLMQNESGVKLICCINYKTAIPCGGEIANGKVIGEFVCDRIVDIPYSQYFVDYYHTMPQDDLEATCLCMGHIDEYLLSKNGYGWHISDLVIYDKPKELSEFYKPLKYDNVDGAKVIHCGHYMDEEMVDSCEFNDGDCSLKGCKELRALYQITRPPQSWCYVEVK